MTGQTERAGASVTLERAQIKSLLRGQSHAADHKLLTSALRFVSHPRLSNNLTPHTDRRNPTTMATAAQIPAETAPTTTAGPKTGSPETLYAPAEPTPTPFRPAKCSAPTP